MLVQWSHELPKDGTWENVDSLVDAFPSIQAEDNLFFSRQGTDAILTTTSLDLDRIASEVIVETVKWDDASPCPSSAHPDADLDLARHSARPT